VSLDRPAVLIVDRDSDTRDRVGRWVEDAGLDVVACPGPTAPEFTCIGSGDGHCPPAQEADLIVLDLWLESDAVDREGCRSARTVPVRAPG
jgi:CheY-like chemotaxis protein